eukprot:6201973-Pleurochrysis_carterae.AAC.3
MCLPKTLWRTWACLLQNLSQTVVTSLVVLIAAHGELEAYYGDLWYQFYRMTWIVRLLSKH